ncbi:MAG TPA: copper oxidase, partial [Afipia sp.]
MSPFGSQFGLAQNASNGARLYLTLRPTPLALQQGKQTPVWSLHSDGPSSGPGFVSRVRRGDTLNLDITSELPTPVAVDVRGINGAARAEPLLSQPPLSANGKASLTIPLKQAGTFLIDPRLLGDGGERPLLPRVLVVEDNAPGIDRDEVLLIEDWRLRNDGSALTPGRDASGTTTLYTLNRTASFDLNVKRNERIRLRIVNGCQRAIVALKIADHDLLVMAFDGEAAEPFIARDGQIVLGPGTRADAFVDATRPSGTASDILLHDGTKAMPVGRIVTSGEARAASLPVAAPLAPSASPRIDLKTAQRFDLSLDP